MYVDLAWCLVLFFALSFIFQLGVSVYSWVAKSGYYAIFHNDRTTNKDTNEDLMQYRAFMQSNRSDDEMRDWADDMLRFNWARFVEYSVSGSVVLCTISLVAGISDYDLLLCIFLLSASCMLMGLGAEYCMRISFALKMIANIIEKTNQTLATLIIKVIVPQLRAAFWILHAMAWVCIILPWYIISLHYRGWWNQCTTPNAKGEATKTEPPDFVKAIVVMQGILFMLFGVVQLVQFFFPHKRRVVEVTYILLSLTAKVLLGAILMANVLMV